MSCEHHVPDSADDRRREIESILGDAIHADIAALPASSHCAYLPRQIHNSPRRGDADARVSETTLAADRHRLPHLKSGRNTPDRLCLDPRQDATRPLRTL